MSKSIISKVEIEQMEGTCKTHFLNSNAIRTNKSLGDVVGLTGFGFHIVEIEPGYESTEYHVHYFEDECVYVLDGNAEVTIGEDTFGVGEGDFIGYPANGLPHTMINTGSETLSCIVVGQRLAHDEADYPRLNKRIFRNQDRPWQVIDIENIDFPGGNRGKK
ncbi:cupin [Enterovibrio norvegicus]|uniref:cupin domain-containing protein n=1 Tax=Enterovibrio norvegicus TaxID=188144 RepID=UPI000C838E35|nr:cupin domain-containing protein [Enterovibrio norvegicus]MCC4798158.1 cupin domain-containing protein [Enterovibrio norvegicus]PMH72157.1 cupin [Enterovibrio norvegicus]PMI32431.1 cupin [Enterovibrio norvegicus]PMI37996.1 cupin [Enterovibrio norvegicus]PMN56621.1 cupin [Enterovibrio norvegicus]